MFSHGTGASCWRLLSAVTTADGDSYGCRPAFTVVSPGALSTIDENTPHDANVATFEGGRRSLRRTNSRTPGNGLRIGSLLSITSSCAWPVRISEYPGYE